MPLVVAMDDIEQDKAKRIERVNGIDTPIPGNVTFFRQSAHTPIAPCATLNLRDIPGRIQKAHYHDCDSFQIFVGGKGKLGRRDVSPYCVHFTRAYTPYGPLQSDEEVGWASFTLRTRYQTGAQRFPEAKDKLRRIPNHQPWQAMKTITFPDRCSSVSLQDVTELKDDQGLFVHALTMAPHTRTAAADPSGGDGQFVVALKGSLIHEGKEHKAMTVAFIKPVEDAFQISAGAQGLEALILNFPRVSARADDVKSPSAVSGLRKWQCVLCAFAYDEALGMPEDGIPAGTRWQDVPDSWSCPDCSATKSDFQMVEV